MMFMQNHDEPESELRPKPPDWNYSSITEPDETEELENEDDESRIFASSQETVTALDEALRQNPKLYYIFCGIALKWIRWYFFKDSIDDHNAVDVVNVVLFKIMNCDRKWEPIKVPNITNLVFMSIVSYIRNQWKKKNNNLISIDIYNEDGELNEANIIDLQRAYIRKDLEQQLFGEQLEDLIEKLFTKLKNDTEAYCVLDELLKNDYGKVKNPVLSIASNLGMTEISVKNAVRRIKRKITKLNC